MSATGNDPSGEDYFRSIESAFVRLRGAPLLLSPADWQTARRWHEAGVPLSVVREVMESVFARLRERHPKRRISSLSYCAPAVEEAWREIQELSVAPGRLEAESVDVPRRLEALAGALPENSPIGKEIGDRLGRIEGAAESVEKALEALDARLLDLADEALDSGSRAELSEQTRAALDRALSGGGLEASADLEQRLFREFLRRRLGLPTLSLFAALPRPPSE